MICCFRYSQIAWPKSRPRQSRARAAAISGTLCWYLSSSSREIQPAAFDPVRFGYHGQPRRRLLVLQTRYRSSQSKNASYGTSFRSKTENLKHGANRPHSIFPPESVSPSQDRCPDGTIAGNCLLRVVYETATFRPLGNWNCNQDGCESAHQELDQPNYSELFYVISSFPHLV